MATIFTKIINGEIPCYKIDSNENYFAFLDVNPLVMGHTLVVPRAETDYIFDLPPEEIAEIFKYAQHIAAKIKQAINCKKVAIVVIGLEVLHAHIHLIPINTMDDVNFSREKLNLTKEQFQEIQQKIVSF